MPLSIALPIPSPVKEYVKPAASPSTSKPPRDSAVPVKAVRNGAPRRSQSGFDTDMSSRAGAKLAMNRARSCRGFVVGGRQFESVK